MRYYLPCLLFVAALPPASGAEGDGRFTTRDVTFRAACDGTEQRYVLMLPNDFEPQTVHHVLLALHGHGSDRWQFSAGTSPTGKAARDIASQRNFVLILPDYRAKTSWMGPKAEADVCQIIAEVKTQFRVGKVFLCGGSMGGSSALTFTAIHPELIDGVAAVNGTANHLEYEKFQDAIGPSFSGTKREIPQEYIKRSAEYWPERFTMPVGITASGKDIVVPPASVMRLAKILEQLDRRVLAIYREDMAHASKPEDIRRVLDFIIDQATRKEQRNGDEQEASNHTRDVR